MISSVDIAIVGATGQVGAAVLEHLHDSDIPTGRIYPLASDESAGSRVAFGQHNLSVHALSEFDFSQVQLCFFCVPADVAATYIDEAVQAGCYCIDFSTHSRLQKSVPLLVHGVNEDALADWQGRVLASPDSSIVHLAQILAPLTAIGIIERVNAVLLRAVSEHGRRAIDELSQQSIALFNLKSVKKQLFASQIAFNVLPHACHGNGNNNLADDLAQELSKVTRDEDLQVNLNLVQVPVFYGHSMSLQIEFGQSFELAQVKRLIKQSGQLHLVEQKINRPDSISDAVNQSGVFIGNIRQDRTWPDGINLWAVADNIHQGAAINGVQIAQTLVKSYL